MGYEAKLTKNRVSRESGVSYWMSAADLVKQAALERRVKALDLVVPHSNIEITDAAAGDTDEGSIKQRVVGYHGD